ncbi:MAG: RidA family protein [Desulfovibrio sp.]|nr:RidA family protein [Desulfovibrio sp.]MCA1985432.1 RidA family protein [Desulfovibrio sp.]
MQFLHTDKAPKAIGPYSQAVIAGGFVFMSGQIPLIPGTTELAGTEIESQTRQVLANIGAVLEAAGCTPADVVQSRVFLADMKDFQAMNALYAGFFGEHKPVRTTIQVAGLPMGALVEIECLAMKP